jgi:hypothetical protein
MATGGLDKVGTWAAPSASLRLFLPELKPMIARFPATWPIRPAGFERANYTQHQGGEPQPAAKMALTVFQNGFRNFSTDTGPP